MQIATSYLIKNSVFAAILCLISFLRRRKIMLIGIIILAVVTLVLLGICFVQYKKLKTLQLQLKELLQETSAQTEEKPQPLVDDMNFKTDKNLVIIFVNDSLCQNLGFTKEALIGKSVFGTLMEDSESTKSNVLAYANKILKKTKIVNNEILLRNAQGKTLVVQCHQRPILNEILECTGISFICKNISSAKELQKQLLDFNERDILTQALNQEAFYKCFERDFKRAKRYHKDFSLLVLETKDLCKFINQGISFERGDNLLKAMYNLCAEKVKKNCSIGRFDQTKFGLILNGYSREKTDALAQDIYEASKPIIKKLGVDTYNAQMLILSYTELKGFTDTFDNMLERTKRHIQNALKKHQYGIITSVNDKKNISAPTKYEKD